MKKAETDFFRALKAYIAARDRLKATREIVLEEGFSRCIKGLCGICRRFI